MFHVIILRKRRARKTSVKLKCSISGEELFDEIGGKIVFLTLSWA